MTKIEITTIGHQGDGIGYIDDKPVYVPYSVTGDVLDIEIDNNRGAINEIITPSNVRQKPICQYFTICGGCSLQHVKDAEVLEFKASLIEEEFKNNGIKAPNEIKVNAAYESGRRRAKFNAKRDKDGLVFGFMAQRSNDLINIEACPILAASLSNAIADMRELCRTLLKPNDSMALNVTLCDNGLDIDVEGLKPIGKWSRQELEALAIAANKAKLLRLTINGESAFMLGKPFVKIEEIPVELPPNSFLQATKTCENMIGDTMMKWAKGAKRAIDLFSGVGTFSLRLKKIADVNAYELSIPAIEALNKASKAAAGGHALTGIVRDLFRVPVSPLEVKNIDLAVLDPARAGANAQVQKLIKTKIKRVIYISCEPKSFAADAKILIDGGYKFKKLEAFDQFRFAPHVELIGLFEK